MEGRHVRDRRDNERLLLEYLAKLGMLRPETDDAPEILVYDLKSLPNRDTEKKPIVQREQKAKDGGC